MNALHIVWSPRRIPQALDAIEALDVRTVFICGMNEHDGCATANQIVQDTPDVDVYVLSYDDQCPTQAQLDLVLEHQQATGDIVSGWHLPGQNSPFGSATRPSWGTIYLDLVPECMYLADEIRNGAELIPSHYFAALTAIPRQAMLDCPIWALKSFVGGENLKIWPNPHGIDESYDKGCCSDWTLAVDLIHAGYRIWIARDAEVLHLAPLHGVPAHKFYIAEDPAGVYWDRRPRTLAEFEKVAA